MLVIIFGLLFIMFPILTGAASPILMALNRRHAMLFFCLFILAIGVLTLRYHPLVFSYMTPDGDDSSFHYASIRSFNKIASLTEFLKYIYSSSVKVYRYEYRDYPIFGLFLYFISKVGVPVLSSAIVAMVTYFLLMFPLIDLFRKSIIKSNILFFVSFTTLFLIHNYRYTTSGMRYALIIGILIYLFYKDSERGFRNDWFLLWYIVPILVHSSAIYYVGIRLLFFLIRDISKAFAIFLTVLFPLIITIGPRILSFFNVNYLTMISQKIISYQDNTRFSEVLTQRLLLRTGVGDLVALLIILLVVINYGLIKESKFKYFIYINFYVACLNIGMMPYLNIVDRNLFILYPMSILTILLLKYDVYYKKSRTPQTNFEVLLYLILAVFVVTGVVYNNNFPWNLFDFSPWQLPLKNIFQFFSGLEHL